MRKLLLALVLFAWIPGTASGADSDLPEDVQLYNEGVEYLLSENFFLAEMRFRKAINLNDELAQAHNNLAFVLRKQGTRFYTQAINHYAAAIELAPDMPEVYMSRGVLHVERGNIPAAQRDLDRLLTLDPEMAAELEHVIETGDEKESEPFLGTTPKL